LSIVGRINADAGIVIEIVEVVVEGIVQKEITAKIGGETLPDSIAATKALRRSPSGPVVVSIYRYWMPFLHPSPSSLKIRRMNCSTNTVCWLLPLMTIWR